MDDEVKENPFTQETGASAKALGRMPRAGMCLRQSLLSPRRPPGNTYSITNFYNQKNKNDPWGRFCFSYKSRLLNCVYGNLHEWLTMTISLVVS